jgi:OmpA-OmpF porin, OOP family
MRHVVKWLLAAAVGLTALPAAAELQFGRMDTGLYLGGSVGGSEYRNACDGTAALGVGCDEKDVGWRGFAGWQFNRYIGLELGYANLGKAEASGGGASASLKSRGVDLVGVFTYPFNDMFGVYGKAGMARMRTKINSTIGNVTENSTDFTFGGGVRFNFARNFGARLEWQRFHDVGDENTTGKGKIDYWSIGLLYGFY